MLNPNRFKDYKKMPEKTKSGAQKKAEWSGRYESGAGKNVFLKKSEQYLADDISEVGTSNFLELGIGEQAVLYSFIKLNKHEGRPVYVESEIREGFESLKDRLGFRPWMVLGANPLLPSEKEKIGNLLLTKEQEEDVARILAACLWVREYDCQLGNLFFYKDKGSSQERIGKFDDGWGLTGICKDKHHHVDLFTKKAFVGKIGTHTDKLQGVPTNHFNDFPHIIRSEAFIKALKEIVGKATRANINERANKFLDEVGSTFTTEAEKKQVLIEFAKHIGLLSEKEGSAHFFDNMKAPEIRKSIYGSLTKRLKERADSMDLLRCLLELDMAIKGKKNPEKTSAILRDLQNVIQQKFTVANGYGPEVTIGDILPPFDPLAKSLFKKLLAKHNIENKYLTQFCKDLTRDETLLTKFQLPPTPKTKTDLKEKPPILPHYSKVCVIRQDKPKRENNMEALKKQFDEGQKPPRKPGTRRG